MSTKAAPELMRDFEVLLDERLGDERRRRRKAERLGRLSLILAGFAVLASALVGYALFDRRGPGINAGVVRAGEVRVVDGAGRVRGRWTVLSGGSTRLSFLDEHGTERLRLTLLANGAAGISLADSRGEGRVVLSLEGGAESRFTFADAAGTPRMVLGLSPRQAGSLIFADAAGVPSAAFGLQDDGSGTFLLPGAQSAVDSVPADTTDG